MTYYVIKLQDEYYYLFCEDFIILILYFIVTLCFVNVSKFETIMKSERI